MNILTASLLLLWDVCWFIGQSVIQWVVGPAEKVVANNICLITGSAGEIGRHFALEFAKKGATLVLWDINAEGNEDTAADARNLGVKAYAYTCDVARRETVYEVAERVKREVGDVTILINNASVMAGKSFLKCADELLEKTLKTNCHAHFWTVKAFLPGMIAMDHGHIITVASHLGLIATPYMEDYCASHFAAVGFHESLSHTLKAQRIDGVKTTLICPYSVNTGMFTGSPVKRDLGIFPSSRTDCYVRRAMKGILIDQPVMCVPRAMYLAAFLKHVLPWEAQLLYFKFLGANKSMYGCAQTEEAHQR